MDADGFVRTLPDAIDSGSDDDSCLEFCSDEDEGTVGPLTTADTKAADPFFSVPAPHAWNLSSARKDAEEARPYQTTINHKIRNARITAEVPAIPDDADMTPATAPGEEVDGSNDEDETHPIDEHSEERSMKKKISVDAGKKRKRKEAAAAVATFESLNLSRALLKAIEVLEWTAPTPIQARAIPYVLAGRDVCGSAVTGSGKTAAFVLPIVERLLRSGVDNATRVVILLPTRELAAQCHAVIQGLCKHTSIRSALAVGGLSNKAQEVSLRARPHIIVATPGRLIDHVRNAHSFTLDDVEILVMDEADRLLEMGFKDEVEEIIRFTPSSARQTLLFSATMSPSLHGLIKLSLKNPVNMAVDPVYDVATTLSQEFIRLKPSQESNKDATLFSLVTRSFSKRTIIFFKQKITAHRFKILFGLTDLRAAELHGNLTQAQRLEALDLFREDSVDFLLCTDLAARGLDIAGVEAVINYDMPNEVTEYVHRVGRTARAGKAGRACSIVCSASNDERKVLKLVAKRAKNQLSARIIQPAVLGKWRAWIDNLAGASKLVLKEEKQEKEMRMAEIELGKADNLLKYSEDIYSRPARTWFQSTKEKDSAKDAAREARGIAPRGKLPAPGDGAFATFSSAIRGGRGGPRGGADGRSGSARVAGNGRDGAAGRAGGRDSAGDRGDDRVGDRGGGSSRGRPQQRRRLKSDGDVAGEKRKANQERERGYAAQRSSKSSAKKRRT
jgi:ATP-dependent RNA helicase DDX27